MKLTNNQKIQLIDSLDDKVVLKEKIINFIANVEPDDFLKIFDSLRKIKKIEYVFQDYYYLKSEDERQRAIKNYSTFELIGVVLNKLNIKWYFGLETANDLNKVVWQPSKEIQLINTKFSKVITINKEKVRFHKIKKELVKDLIKYKTKNRIILNVSNNKKTLEDFKYFNKKFPFELVQILEKNE